ncbi:MAG: amino acid permease [Candidatus Symbiobacter sp.]|nr:amino acid permease [Candidatus Symbiobacter sp.]
MNQLKKSLTTASGVSLFLNIVIGAGLLVLPGLAYQQVGNLSILSWLLCGLLALPFVLVFMIMGQKFPDAGGIPHYALRAFGDRGQRIAAFWFLGAVVLGLPSIALTGGYYLDAVWPASPHFYGFGLIIAAVTLHVAAGSRLGRVMTAISSSLLVILLVLMGLALMGIDYRQAPTLFPSFASLEPSFIAMIFAPLMMIFFAFTGWEVGANAAEDFINPRRDYPRAMIISFVIATFLYVLLAAIIQLAGLKTGFTSPFVELTRPVLGEGGKYLVALVVGLIIFANLFGAIFSVSRLVFALGRDRILPAYFAATHDGTPRRAIFWVTGLLVLVLGLDGANLFPNFHHLFAMAGQNLLLLCAVGAASLWRLSPLLGHKILAGLSLIIVTVILLFAGVAIYYPIILAGLALLSHYLWPQRQS